MMSKEAMMKGKPILFSDNTGFNALMEERKTLIAKWAKAILETR